jgi:cell pole-organizing protein PopZ
MPEKETTDNSDNPTMEEILQTIRGVIAGEEDGTEGAAPADDDVLELTEVAEPEEASKGDVLDDIDNALAEAKPEPNAEPAPPPPPAPKQESESVIGALGEDVEIPKEFIDPLPEAKPEPAPEPEPKFEPEPEPEPEPVKAARVPEPDPEPYSEPQPVRESIALATSALDHDETLLSEQSMRASSTAIKDLLSSIPKQGPGLRSGSMLEDLVIEAMRPYLKEWLDKNLPSMVKRLVEKELRRLVPDADEL